MPKIANQMKPFVEFALVLGAGTDDYAEHVASCSLNPSGGSEARWKGGTPDAKFAHRTKSDWTCAMRVAQDDTAGSLHSYLLANEGETVPAAFTPISGGTTYYCDLVLAAPAIGGDIDTFGEATVTHTIVGKPSTTPPV